MNCAERDNAAPDNPVKRAAMIAPRLAELGGRYDAAPVFPAESLRCIAQAGLHSDFAPEASGGWVFVSAEEKYIALMNVLRIIGRADLSAGRLFEGHINAMALFDWYGSPRQKAELAHQLERGAFYGVWATEPAPGVIIQREQDGRITLKGVKSFASGAGGLDFALVTAQQDGKDRQLVIVAADDPSRADLTQWRVRGMRATTSGLYDLGGIDLHTHDLLGDPGVYDIEPRFTAGAWRFAAVQLGGIEALLTETQAALSEVARSDPLQRARFADAVAATRSAFLWVREAALRAARDDPDAAAFARMTRGIVERAAFEMMELSARLVGTRSAMDGERIDKISRDLALYLRQAGPDYARDQAAIVWIDHDAWGEGDALW